MRPLVSFFPRKFRDRAESAEGDGRSAHSWPALIPTGECGFGAGQGAAPDEDAAVACHPVSQGPFADDWVLSRRCAPFRVPVRLARRSSCGAGAPMVLQRVPEAKLSARDGSGRALWAGPFLEVRTMVFSGAEVMGLAGGGVDAHGMSCLPNGAFAEVLCIPVVFTKAGSPPPVVEVWGPDNEFGSLTLPQLSVLLRHSFKSVVGKSCVAECLSGKKSLIGRDRLAKSVSRRRGGQGHAQARRRLRAESAEGGSVGVGGAEEEEEEEGEDREEEEDDEEEEEEEEEEDEDEDEEEEEEEEEEDEEERGAHEGEEDEDEETEGARSDTEERSEASTSMPSGRASRRRRRRRKSRDSDEDEEVDISAGGGEEEGAEEEEEGEEEDGEEEEEGEEDGEEEEEDDEDDEEEEDDDDDDDEEEEDDEDDDDGDDDGDDDELF